MGRQQKRVEGMSTFKARLAWLSEEHIKVGDEIATNDLPDAAWFTVIDGDSQHLYIKESNTDNAAHIVRRSLVIRVRRLAEFYRV